MEYKVLSEIKAKTTSGEITLKPGQVIRFQPDKATKYINEGKIIPFNKSYRSEELTLDKCAEIIKGVIDKISEHYIYGTLGYIRKYHNDLYKDIRDSEERINEVCNVEQGIDVTVFKQALNDMYKLYINAIQLYKEH